MPGGTQVQVESELTTSTPLPWSGALRWPRAVERPHPTLAQDLVSHSRPHPHQSGADLGCQPGREAQRSWIIYEAR